MEFVALRHQGTGQNVAHITGCIGSQFGLTPAQLVSPCYRQIGLHEGLARNQDWKAKAQPLELRTCALGSFEQGIISVNENLTGRLQC